MERTTLGTKLSDIEKKLGGTGEMPPAETYDPLLWHLDRIESLIDEEGGRTWSPFNLDYTFDEIYTAVETQDEEILSIVKDEIKEIIENERYDVVDYIEFNTKDRHVFKLVLSCTGWIATRTFDENKEIIVSILYEIDAETGDAIIDILDIEAREFVS